MADTARAILDHPVIAERYFFPRRAPLADPVVIETGGVELHCAASASGGEAPTVLHFHGNGEVVADWLPDFGPALNAAGLDAFFAEYRGYGGSTGAPALATMLDDALAVADGCGAPLDRMVVYGRSVGSIFALHVAARRDVAGLVIESGIADVFERLDIRLAPEELGTDAAGLRAAASALLDHRAKLAATAAPVLVLHALGDHLVPVDHARRLAEWAGPRATLRLYERGDHNSIHAFNGAAIVTEVAAFAAAAVA